MSERRARARRKAPAPRASIGLVMIVKDDEAILSRCLQSLVAAELVDHWTICDTGSTDRTRELVRFELRDIPGRLYRHKWRSFAHNRTAALRRARGSADWLLVADADFTVRYANEGLREFLAGARALDLDAWHVQVHDNGGRYRLPLLIRGDRELTYSHPTHECLDTTNTIPLLGLEFDHRADGSSREHKFERDLELLAPGVDAGDPRDTFYAAQSFRFLGQRGPAAVLYGRRAKMENGWEEERWYALYQAAVLSRDVEKLLEAWRARPWRHEPLSAAAALVAADPRADHDSLFLEPAARVGL